MKKLLLLAVLALASPAIAHDQWSNGDKVPDWVKASCCGKADAHQIDPADVHHDAVNQFYYFDHGYEGKVNDKQVIPSEDGHYWIFYACPGENCIVRCFFVPMVF